MIFKRLCQSVRPFIQSQAVRKVLTFLASRSMIILSKISVEGTNDSVHTLLPAWDHLISNLKDPAPEIENELRKSVRSLLVNLLPPEAKHHIPSLEKRNTPVLNTWSYQNDHMEWEIAPNDLVLDIGFGGWPFRRANHLADKFSDRTSHRTELLARDDRPFLEVDIERLPFVDQAYDFIFCSHVLEHIDNPGRAIRELMRTGRGGYIEIPTRLSDVMFNFTRLPNHHRWHGMILGDTLVFVEWNDSERRDLGNHYFNLLHSEYENDFQDFFERNRDLFFVSYHWKMDIHFLIIDKEGVIIDSSRGLLHGTEPKL